MMGNMKQTTLVARMENMEQTILDVGIAKHRAVKAAKKVLPRVKTSKNGYPTKPVNRT